MLSLVYIGAGGFFGAITRHVTSSLLNRVASGYLIPIGSLVVNIIGCFLIGLISAKSLNSDIPRKIHLFLTAGFLGGFTTYSSFGIETFTLLKEGQWGNAILLSSFHIIFGLLGVAVGVLIGKKI